MSIGDEGQFRFTNGTAIDSGLNKDRILDVINHRSKETPTNEL